eukprot:6930002-Lingulodinium_polyedra.AAC.1
MAQTASRNQRCPSVALQPDTTRPSNRHPDQRRNLRQLKFAHTPEDIVRSATFHDAGWASRRDGETWVVTWS